MAAAAAALLRRSRSSATSLVAAEKPANERCVPSSPIAENDGAGIGGRGTGVHARTDPNVSPARHHVRVAVGEDEDVARGELNLLLADQTPVAAAFCQDAV
jgi:hypothetical protein